MTKLERKGGKQIQQSLVMLLTLSLLLIPATCSSAAGPHSIYDDPLAHEAHHSHEQHQSERHYLDIATMSEEAMLLHLAFGDSAPSKGSNATLLDIQDDSCESAPRLRDMPSSMAMSALSMPAMIGELMPFDLPVAEAPPPAHTVVNTGIATILESPPPQA